MDMNNRERALSGRRRYLPSLDWILNYRRADLAGDCTAGFVVAVMLAPQGMAYALLAGLPPEMGLYSSILPLIIYAVLGTSRALSVGPMAVISLMVASGLAPLAAAGSDRYVELALSLALLVGMIKIIMALLRFGFLADLLSHAVISGYTSAAALIIIADQVRHLLGLPLPRQGVFYQSITGLMGGWQPNVYTACLGLASVGFLLISKDPLRRVLKRLGLSDGQVVPLVQGAPLALVAAAAVWVWGMGWADGAGVAIVGALPRGLPSLALPSFSADIVRDLLPLALAISLVSFTGSIAVAKSLTSRRRQRIEANWELLGLGAANVGAALSGGVAVTGGLSRSLVNSAAGANTGLASVITALLIAIVVLFFTPLFYYLPRAALAAIIAVAAARIVDLRTALHIWRYSKADAASLGATFLAVLALGVEQGIAIGVGASLLLFLWRTSTPRVVELGRLDDGELFRSVAHHRVRTYDPILILRIDESLYFANANQLERQLLNEVAERPQIDHLVLVFSAVNYVDASALETLGRLNEELAAAGVDMHLAEVKERIMHSFSKTDFPQLLKAGRIYASTHEAIEALNRPKQASYHI